MHTLLISSNILFDVTVVCITENTFRIKLLHNYLHGNNRLCNTVPFLLQMYIIIRDCVCLSVCQSEITNVFMGLVLNKLSYIHHSGCAIFFDKGLDTFLHEWPLPTVTVRPIGIIHQKQSEHIFNQWQIYDKQNNYFYPNTLIKQIKDCTNVFLMTR